MSGPPFFIVGSGRSGTTMLKAMLDRDPTIGIPWESYLIKWTLREWRHLNRGGRLNVEYWMRLCGRHLDEMGISTVEVRRRLERLPSPIEARAVIETVFQVFLDEQGKQRWGDKTPAYSTSIPILAKTFPDSQFIHLVRDGRDVALSFVDQNFGSKAIAGSALTWKKRSAAARRDGSALGPGRYLEVAYEDLVERPEQELAAICGFLGIAFSDDMLEFYKEPERGIPKFEDRRFAGLAQPVKAGMRDWRTQMSASDQRLFEAIAGRELSGFGYERRFTRVSLSTLPRLVTAHVRRQYRVRKNRTAAWVWRWRIRRGT